MENKCHQVKFGSLYIWKILRGKHLGQTGNSERNSRVQVWALIVTFPISVNKPIFAGVRNRCHSITGITLKKPSHWEKMCPRDMKMLLLC